MLAFKDEGVKGNVDGVAFLLKKNKIDHVHGTGRIAGPGKVDVTLHRTARRPSSRRRPSSSPPARMWRSCPGIDIDEKQIVSSTGALSLPKVPERLLVVGAGVIGLELGSVWRRLGSKVTVVEFLDRILPGMDGEVAKTHRAPPHQAGHDVPPRLEGDGRREGRRRARSDRRAGEGRSRRDHRARMSCWSPSAACRSRTGLASPRRASRSTPRSASSSTASFETNVSGIYAIGDVIAGPMLAHKAEDEGIAVAEILAGQAGQVNHDVIPNVIYTFPEVASVGKSEEELKAAGIAYNVGKFPFTANGRAKVNRTTDGFVKVLADAETDRILGVHIIGARASEMIAEAAVIMEFGGSAEDLARTCHAHPTLTEAVKEAALAVAKRAIHM